MCAKESFKEIPAPGHAMVSFNIYCNSNPMSELLRLACRSSIVQMGLILKAKSQSGFGPQCVKAHPCYSLSHCMHASDVDCPIALAQKGAVRLTVISGLKPVNSGYQP